MSRYSNVTDFQTKKSIFVFSLQYSNLRQKVEIVYSDIIKISRYMYNKVKTQEYKKTGENISRSIISGFGVCKTDDKS